MAQEIELVNEDVLDMMIKSNYIIKDEPRQFVYIASFFFEQFNHLYWELCVVYIYTL